MSNPVVADRGVVSAATFSNAGGVGPGSLISIFGVDFAAAASQSDTVPLPTAIGDVSVLINDIPAPLIFVGPTQINAQVPWNIAARGQAKLVVKRKDASSPPALFNVFSVAPGLFTLSGQAIAINIDGTLAAPEESIAGLVTHPAKVGDTVVLLATGLGPVDSAIENGAASSDVLRKTQFPPTILVGGQPAKVTFSGLSPQFVGVYQVNAIIPAIPGVAGIAVLPLQIQIAGAITSDAVTIAIRGASRLSDIDHRSPACVHASRTGGSRRGTPSRTFKFRPWAAVSAASPETRREPP